jgi:N-acetylglutamate synthase-like GNAT family acetyltransferase
LSHFFYAEIDGEIIGVIGAVPCGAHALLRSLAVATASRGKGLGSRLVTAAESHALDLGGRGLYLLTLTAEGFFRKQGYQPLPREKAPEALRATTEFTYLCPASSVLMFKPLT